jgi:acylphosphatase
LSTDDSDLTRNKNNTNVKLLLSTFWSLIKDTRAYQSASEIRTLFFNFGIIDIEGFVDNLDDINFEIVEESQQKKIIDWCIKNSKIPKNKDIFEGILGESDPTFIRQNQKYISELLKSYRVEGRLLVKIIQSVDDSESEAIARRMIKIPSEILRFYDIDIRKKSK